MSTCLTQHTYNQTPLGLIVFSMWQTGFSTLFMGTVFLAYNIQHDYITDNIHLAPFLLYMIQKENHSTYVDCFFVDVCGLAWFCPSPSEQHFSCTAVYLCLRCCNNLDLPLLPSITTALNKLCSGQFEV